MKLLEEFIACRVLDRLSDSDDLIENAPQDTLIAEIVRAIRKAIRDFYGDPPAPQAA